MDMSFMRTYFFYVFIVLGMLSVLYFSWIESPRLSLNGALPKWLTKWTDNNENDNMRTAVPFIFLSVCMGILLILKEASLRWWIISLLLLVCLVFLAEIGQLFLPLRRFDWEDIGWAVWPSFIILSLFYNIKKWKF